VGRRALAALAQGDEPWAIPVFVVNGFVRVVTYPRVFRSPTPAPQPAALNGLFESPTLRVLHPGERFWARLGAAIEEGHSRGDLMLDAAIMALCREHGVTTILSADRDFRRFPSIALQPL